jgi:hypothetical protein
MRSDGFKFPVTVKKWKRRAVLAKCHLGDMEYLMRPVHVRRSSLDQQPALLKRVCHLVRCVGWRDLVRQVDMLEIGHIARAATMTRCFSMWSPE